MQLVSCFVTRASLAAQFYCCAVFLLEQIVKVIFLLICFAGDRKFQEDDRMTLPRKSISSFMLLFVMFVMTSPVLSQIIQISPDYGLYFGHISEGKKAVRDLLIYNIGSATLNITNLRIEGTDASLFSFKENPGTISLGIAQMLVLSIQFQPQTAAPVSARVVITSNANTSPDAVDLTGEGTDLSNGFIAFERIFGRPDGDSAGSVRITDDGGFIIAGSTTLLDADYGDAALIKTDKYGQIEWNRWYGLEEWSEGFSEGIPTPDGGYIAAGSHAYSDRQGEPDMYVVKTDAAGNVTWEQSYGLSEFKPDAASDIITTTDGGFLIAGRSQSGANLNAYLVKIDSDGNILWQKTYGGVGGENASSIKRTDDGGYVFVGSTSTDATGGANDYDFYLVKIDADGNVQWQKRYGGTDWDKAGCVIVTPDKGFLMSGYTASPEFGAVARDVFLVKTDAAGNKQWQNLYGWEHKDRASKVVATSDGGYLVVGGSERYYDAAFETWRSDMYVIKTDGSGNELWSKMFGGLHEDGASGVRQLSDGGYIISGSTRSYSKDADMYLLKIGPHGGFSSILKSDKPIPQQFRLLQNYPNPFNNSTMIPYQLPRNSQVQLYVYNVVGQKVATLVNGFKTVGYHTVLFKADNLTSGLYFYQIKTNKNSEIKRMLFLK